MKKLSDRLTGVFYVLFLALFGWLFFNVVFLNPWFDYKPWLALPLAALWLAAFAGVFALAGRLAQFWAGHEKRCLLAFLLLLCAVQLFFYWQTAGYPTRDFERVYTGAYNYTIAGFIEDPYLDYFYKYPNNMPLMILLQFLFRAIYRVTGLTNFLVWGALFNAFCLDLGYLFVYLCAKKLGGVRAGVTALAVLGLCIPLQCYISIFYTDAVTLWFAPFALWFWLCLRGQTSRKKWLLQAAVFGLVVGFGMKIKYSVVIALVAILIDGVLRRPRRAAAVGAAALAGFLLWNSVFDGFMYAHILDRAKARDAATPFLSWVMMALKGDGTHNADDNYVIWYWPTKEQKEWQARTEIRRRLAEYGPVGYLEFLNRKGVRSFGTGDLNVMNMAADSPMRQTFLVEGISENGRWYDQFRYLTQGYHLAVFALTLAGAALALRRRDWSGFVPHLTMFGLYLFLLVWEAGQRYLLNYMGIFVLCAVFGLLQLDAARARRQAAAAQKQAAPAP